MKWTSVCMWKVLVAAAQEAPAAEGDYDSLREKFGLLHHTKMSFCK